MRRASFISLEAHLCWLVHVSSVKTKKDLIFLKLIDILAVISVSVTYRLYGPSSCIYTYVYLILLLFFRE